MLNLKDDLKQWHAGLRREEGFLFLSRGSRLRLQIVASLVLEIVD
jgi:hypothetical protein